MSEKPKPVIEIRNSALINQLLRVIPEAVIVIKGEESEVDRKSPIDGPKTEESEKSEEEN